MMYFIIFLLMMFGGFIWWLRRKTREIERAPEIPVPESLLRDAGPFSKGP